MAYDYTKFSDNQLINTHTQTAIGIAICMDQDRQEIATTQMIAFREIRNEIKRRGLSMLRVFCVKFNQERWDGEERAIANKSIDSFTDQWCASHPDEHSFDMPMRDGGQVYGGVGCVVSESASVGGLQGSFVGG